MLAILTGMLAVGSPTGGMNATEVASTHPGEVVGHRTLYSRRKEQWFFQHKLTKAVVWEKPEEPAADQVFWWHYKDMDCGYDDLTPVCSGKSIEGCKMACTLHPECGGFNYPHGVLKKKNCESKKAASTTDLYLKEDHAQPPPPGPSANFPPIWPYPKSFTSGKSNVSVVGSGFAFKGDAKLKDLSAAFARYQDLMFPHPVPAATADGAAASLGGVTVTVSDPSPILQLETDESYTLTIPASGPATISAKTVFGAMYGLETLSQLVTFNFDTQSYYVPFAPWTITDAPRFQHREVLVDTSRHFQPVATLKRLILSLTYSKVNTVHWHIVDQQSFPFDSVSRPLLSQKGSYSAQERYTPLDVAEVVEYSRSVGVRMMVEVDGPGHAAIWCKGYPEICPSGAPDGQPSCTEPLNPATNATYELLTDLLKDLTGGTRGSGLFPDNVMHLGGDEVNTACYGSTPSIAKWLAARGLTADGGYESFVKRYQKIAQGMGRDVAGWEEIYKHFGTNLSKSTIIHQWLPGSTVSTEATKNGYRCLWSTDGVWYLDGLGSTAQTMYEQEPCKLLSDEACSTLMMGGGGEQWGETVDTSDLEQTIWPRLGAIGERLWSPRNISSFDAAAKRYSAFRCLLNRRAVRAAPSKNPTARTAPPGPGGCYDQ